MNKIWSSNFIDKLVGVLIVALFVLPFLTPYGYFPVSKFDSEIITLIIASVIGVLVIFKVKQISISHGGIASVCFAGFLLLQIIVTKVRIPGINMAIALEFIVVAVLSVGITSLVESSEENQKKIMLQIAWAALIGATIQGVYGFLQYTGYAEGLRSFILVGGEKGSNIFGNIGQKNDYANFISIGIFALAYLHFIRQINLVAFVLYALFFGFIITVNTSRTSFVYFALAALFSLGFTFINRKDKKSFPENNRVLFLLVGMFVGLLILEALIPKLIAMFFVTDEVNATSGLYRFSGDSIGQSTYRRFYEWYKDIIIFINNPLFGAGWYQFPHEGIYLMDTERFKYIPANSALYTHSHNSPLNILAEAGFIGFFITMIYGFGVSLYKMFKSFNNYATLFLSFMILTIFGQSFFQYPLWYSYFLVFFVLFLSVSKPVIKFENTSFIKIGISMLFLGFVVFCGVNKQIYDRLVVYAIVPQDADDYKNNVYQIEQIIEHNPMWTLPALMVLDNYMLPSTAKTNAVMSVQDQVAYIDRLATSMPYPSAIFKQIIIHKIVGDEVLAMKYANLLAHAYPFFKDQFAQQLQSLPLFGAEASAIYNFKYEDRSIFAKMKKGN